MTDQELDDILAVARTVPSDRRADFFATLGDRLQHSADFGDGVVQRAALAAKRDLLGPSLRPTVIYR